MNRYAEPNLFIIGAMKSGTTYLHSLLAKHPDIYMCYPKEPCYFVDPKELKNSWPEMWEKGYWKSEERYLELFKEAGDSSIIGESSAEYTNYPMLSGIPESIKKFNPESKFIYIMRDPIERVISHYWMHMHYYGKVIDPLRAIKEVPELISISYYAMQLKRYFEFFDKEQFFTITFEELIKDPAQSLHHIFKWLNVDNSFISDDIYKAENVSPQRVRTARGHGHLFRFRNSMLWESISKAFPSWLTAAGSKMAESYYDKKSVSMIELKKYLKPIFLPQVVELEILLNRDFKIWETLHDLQ